MLILFFFLTKVSLTSFEQTAFAESVSLQRALLLGIKIEQLSLPERQLLQNYQIIEKESFNFSLVKSLVLQIAPSIVIIKHPSGVYAYSASGELIRSISHNISHNLDSKSKTAYQDFDNQKKASSNYPIPGSQIPESLYPGSTKYQGFLPGEGFNLRASNHAGYSGVRNSIKQVAKLSQSVIYPFWFDTFLRASTQFGSPQSTTVAGTNPSIFEAETTANLAIVGGQLTSNALGIGSLLIDSYLDKKEIGQYENWANNYSRGSTSYYQLKPRSLYLRQNKLSPIIY